MIPCFDSFARRSPLPPFLGTNGAVARKNDVGRRRNGRVGNHANPVYGERVKIPSTAGSEGSDGCRGGGLLRP